MAKYLSYEARKKIRFNLNSSTYYLYDIGKVILSACFYQ